MKRVPLCAGPPANGSDHKDTGDVVVVVDADDGEERSVPPPNWLDFLLNSNCVAGENNTGVQRETTAAIVAALHNAVVALLSLEEQSTTTTTTTDTTTASNANNANANNSKTMTGNTTTTHKVEYDDNEEKQEEESFAYRLAGCSLLVCTLLRQVLSAKRAVVSCSGNNNDNGDKGCADSATEWIVLLIGRLCQLGYLKTMYEAVVVVQAVDPSGNCSGTDETIFATAVVPEHVVLLHCVKSAVEADLTSYDADILMSIALFLVDLYSNLRRRNASANASSSSEEEVENAVLRNDAIFTTLEILAEILGSSSSIPTVSTFSQLGDLGSIVEEDASNPETDTCVAAADSVATLRSTIGLETSFVEEIGRHTGALLDSMLHEYQSSSPGRKKAVPIGGSNDSTRDRRGPVLVVLVRLLGYLCYNCRSNQDLLRTTLVPPLAIPSMSTSSSATTTTTESSTDLQNERSLLNVLLSCTALAFVCFPLREWSVVSLRLALQDNHENQAAVASLQAQQAVQTTALDDIGMNVELDRTGKVKLTPKTESD